MLFATLQSEQAAEEEDFPYLKEWERDTRFYFCLVKKASLVRLYKRAQRNGIGSEKQRERKKFHRKNFLFISISFPPFAHDETTKIAFCWWKEHTHLFFLPIVGEENLLSLSHTCTRWENVYTSTQFFLFFLGERERNFLPLLSLSLSYSLSLPLRIYKKRMMIFLSSFFCCVKCETTMGKRGGKVQGKDFHSISLAPCSRNFPLLSSCNCMLSHCAQCALLLIKESGVLVKGLWNEGWGGEWDDDSVVWHIVCFCDN